MADAYLTVPGFNRNELARLFSKIKPDSLTGCWNWTAAIANKGYGVWTYQQKYIHAHRVMYSWLVAPLPTGDRGPGSLTLDHLCRNRRCCNPAHLQAVTRGENVLRGEGVTAQAKRRTHCKRGHPLPEQPNRTDTIGRVCVVCHRDWHREKARRNRADERARRHLNTSRA